MNEKILDLLPRVRKPARYAGGEWNAVKKDKLDVDLRVAFCFPDTYEIGMSHLGTRILYGLMNTLPYVWCERAFAPWPDFEAELRQNDLPLYALESGDPLSDFDVLAFTLQYELSYTNVLTMLDLGGLPLRREDRFDTFPLVIAGGPCAFNPEPMSDFIDLFVVGEGEDVTVELMALFRDMKQAGASKSDLLKRAAGMPGVYVPALYDVSYRDDGTVAVVTPRDGAPPLVTKRVVRDLDAAWFPTAPVVPSTEVVHDRVMLELFRGCTRGCRFCQAGHTGRPVRARSPETLIRYGIESIQNTGYDEISLTSLSTSDYAPLEALCDELLAFCEPRRVSLSLPSLRADSFSRTLLEKVQKVRKSGLTFAPEAGTKRLRDVVNKNLTEEDLLSACGIAFEGGYSAVKLYFMCGLPTETDEDILGIAELAHKVFYHWRKTAPDRARGVNITVNVSCFVPKPYTPFQWEGQCTLEALTEKQNLLKGALRRNISFRWHEASTSVLEGALSRGDRRLGRVIETAYRKGCRMDSWHEYFSLDAWRDAFAENGLTMDFYAHRQRLPDELLPWAHISCGVTTEHLLRERERAYGGQPSSDCRTHCLACGAGDLAPCIH